ncbi:MAG: GFA family protein [Roseiarcus sp.]|jgi:hypothetical protein
MDADEARAGLTGGCQCGAVRYRLEAAPSRANVCHCRMCQKAGGAPFMAFADLPLAALHWTRGAPKTFVSSAIAERGFCADCGTPLTYRPLDREEIGVTIASLDHPAAVAPTIQFGVESKIAWLDGVLALPTRDLNDWIDPAALGNRQHPDHET